MTNNNDMFSLKWNNYFVNFVQLFNEQKHRQELVDVTLSCEGKFLKAHKLILSSCSEFFRELFASCSGQHPVIVLHKVCLKDLKYLLRFMYCGEIQVAADDIKSLVELGNAFRVKGLCAVKFDDETPANNSQPSAINNTSIGTEKRNRRDGRKKSSDSSTENFEKPANLPLVDLPKNKKQKTESPKTSNEATKEDFLVCDEKMLTDSNSDLDSISATSIETVEFPATKIETQNRQSTPQHRIENEITNLNNSLEKQDNVTQVNLSNKRSVSVSPNPSSVTAVKETNQLNISSLESLLKSNVENGVSKRRLENDEEQGDSSKTASKSKKQIKTAHEKSPNNTSTGASASTTTTTTTTTTAAAADTTTTTSTTSTGSSIRTSTSSSSSTATVPAVQIPKTPNAFMIFADEWRKKISTEHPDENKKGISIKLSEMWRSLSPESKEMYYALAREAERKHNLKFSIKSREKIRPKRPSEGHDGSTAIHHPEIHLKDEYINDDDIMEIID